MTNEIREFAEKVMGWISGNEEYSGLWCTGSKRYPKVEHRVDTFNPFANTDHCLMGFMELPHPEQCAVAESLVITVEHEGDTDEYQDYHQESTYGGVMLALKSLANSPAALAAGDIGKG